MSAPASSPNATPPVPADPAGSDTADAKDQLESASNAAPNDPQHATDIEVGPAGDSNMMTLGNSIINMTAVFAANTATLATSTETLAAHTKTLAATTETLGTNMQLLATNIGLMTASMQLLAEKIAGMTKQFHRKMDELPCILANSRAGDRGPLCNPTAMKYGYALPLTGPNPRNREELLNFTVSQCIASAESLGLPSLPQDTPVHVRRRQIAGRLGVIIG